MQRVHCLITGRVQGVFYRANTQQQAELSGVKGWVKNLPDGRVEAVMEASRPLLEKLLDWCRQGPEMGYVDHVEVQWLEATGEFEDFSIRG